MIRLYHHPLSGHVHRVELFLTLLDLPFERVNVDPFKRETRAPSFLAVNAFGQVPVLDDDGEVVADSNAILVYLARKHDPAGRWLPTDPAGAARVQRWLSVAAGPLAKGPATARVLALVGRPCDERIAAESRALFDVMDRHLAGTPWLAAAHPTIADLAMYAYTAHAPEGGLSLQPYAHLRAWLVRVEALPRFIGMAKSAIPAELP